MDDINWETADLRELARVRDGLVEKERLHGITEEHLRATESLRRRGAPAAAAGRARGAVDNNRCAAVVGALWQAHGLHQRPF